MRKMNRNPGFSERAMNKRFFRAALAVLCFLGACTDGDSGDQELILSAGSEEGAAARSSRDADGTFFWSPGDRISVFLARGENGGALFQSVNDRRERVKEFSGTISGGGISRTSVFWGIYPYNPVNSCDGRKLVTEVPSVQVAAEGTFADGQFVSIGRSVGLAMTFYHLCGGIKFFLGEEGITRIVLRDSDGNALAGRVEVVLDGEHHPVVQRIIAPASEIVLTPPEGEPCFKTGTDYFLVTLPVTFGNGFDILFEKGGQGLSGKRHVGTALTIHRARFQWSRQPLDSGVLFIPDGMEMECADIVRPGVRQYLEEVDYSSDPDYTCSYVSDYEGTDKPQAAYLSWTGGDADRILFSTSPSFEDICLQVSVSSSPAKVYNLVPGILYYYRVLSGDDLRKEGCVLPVGPLRMVYGVSDNVRDLGGWKAGDRTIRYGRIFRGGRLDNIQYSSSEKKTLLNTLGVDIDLDLRGIPPGSQGGSGEKNPWTPQDPVTYCNIQLWHYFVASTDKFDIPDVSEGVSADQYQLAIRNIIGWLDAGKVVYFHCHGGSDRTGTLAFLIEGLLGVSESDLSKDYELTFFSGSSRKRDGSTGWFFKSMVRYIRTFAPGRSIGEQVTAWAKTRHSDEVDPLTDDEIALLKTLLLE